MVYLYIDRVLKTCSTCLHLYPLHFDVKYIHIRIHIIFHENFTQKTISTASIYILQGNSTAAATVGNMMSYACQLLLMRARARRAYCKKCRVHIGSKSSGWPNVAVLIFNPVKRSIIQRVLQSGLAKYSLSVLTCAEPKPRMQDAQVFTRGSE